MSCDFASTFTFNHLADAFIQSDVQMRRTIQQIMWLENWTNSCSNFHFYYWYFAPVSLEVMILFYWAHGMEKMYSLTLFAKVLCIILILCMSWIHNFEWKYSYWEPVFLNKTKQRKTNHYSLGLYLECFDNSPFIYLRIYDIALKWLKIVGGFYIRGTSHCNQAD